MVESIVKPLRPLKQARNEWFQLDVSGLPAAREGYPLEGWWHYAYNISVLSAVEVARDKDGSSNGPEYHLSCSKVTWPGGIYKATRIDTAQAKWVLAEFDLDGAEEDNHVPHGVVRNFWRPVAEGMVGKECRCKAEEVVIKENRGDYIWRP